VVAAAELAPALASTPTAVLELAAAHNQFYSLLGHDNSEQKYLTSSLLVLCTTSYY
jgi:hypothetical protein